MAEIAEISDDFDQDQRDSRDSNSVTDGGVGGASDLEIEDGGETPHPLGIWQSARNRATASLSQDVKAKLQDALNFAGLEGTYYSMYLGDLFWLGLIHLSRMCPPHVVDRVLQELRRELQEHYDKKNGVYAKPRVEVSEKEAAIAKAAAQEARERAREHRPYEPPKPRPEELAWVEPVKPEVMSTEQKDREFNLLQNGGDRAAFHAWQMERVRELDALDRYHQKMREKPFKLPDYSSEPDTPEIIANQAEMDEIGAVYRHQTDTRDYAWKGDRVLTAEEVAAYDDETYLVRGYQIVMMHHRFDELGSAFRWGQMAPEDVAELKTVFSAFQAATDKRINMLRDDQRSVGTPWDIAYGWMLHRLARFASNQYKRFPDPSPKAFHAVCFGPRFHIHDPPVRNGSFGIDLVLLRWESLLGTPFEHPPKKPPDLADYPERVKSDVAAGFMPVDYVRQFYMARRNAYVLPPIAKG